MSNVSSANASSPISGPDPASDTAPTGPTPTPGAGPARPDDLIWKVLAVVAGVALVGFIVYVVTRPHHARVATFPVAPVTTLPVGSTAPAFALPRLGGGAPVTLAATRGTPTVVNFFASWCRDCQAELGDFAALATRTQGRVAVIGVDANDANGSAAQTLLVNAHATYPVGVDSQAATATAYLLTALPVTFFLDAQGRVVHVSLGTQTAASLAHWTDVLTGAGA